MRLVLLICAVLAATGMVSAPADARALSREDCDALMSELEALNSSDIPTAVTKGPEWTLAHMPDAMARVKRYLLVEEQLRFRCVGKKVPDLEQAVAGAKPKQDKAASRPGLDAQMSAVLSGIGKDRVGAAPEAAPARPAPRHVQRAPAAPPATPPAAASAAPARSPGLDAAYRQLFPMGR